MLDTDAAIVAAALASASAAVSLVASVFFFFCSRAACFASLRASYVALLSCLKISVSCWSTSSQEAQRLAVPSRSSLIWFKTVWSLSQLIASPFCCGDSVVVVVLSAAFCSTLAWACCLALASAFAFALLALVFFVCLVCEADCGAKLKSSLCSLKRVSRKEIIKPLSSSAHLR